MSALRTDYILRNVFNHLLQKEFHTLEAPSDAERKVSALFRNALNTFRRFADRSRPSYIDTILPQLSEGNLYNIVLGTSEELFAHGISWANIVAFFDFIGQLALACDSPRMPPSSVHLAYACFARYVDDKLESWVQAHGGWAGIQSLATTSSWSSRVLSMVRHVGGMVGAALDA